MAKTEGYSTTPKPADPIPGVGPTIEEFVKAGYDPANYPPEGYAEVPSEGLDRYKRGENVFPDGYSTVGAEQVTEPVTDAVTDQTEESADEPAKKKGGKKK